MCLGASNKCDFWGRITIKYQIKGIVSLVMHLHVDTEYLKSNSNYFSLIAPNKRNCSMYSRTYILYYSVFNNHKTSISKLINVYCISLTWLAG